MTGPVNSPYYTPSGDGGGGDPYTGPADVGNLIPTVTMRWTTSPSYNVVEESALPAGDETSSGAAVTEAIAAKLTSLHAAESSMITATSTCVDSYATLKASVIAAINGDVIFGQQDTDTQTRMEQNAVIGGNGGTSVTETVNSPIQEGAKEFAQAMRPVQQLGLLKIGNALELIGQYIGAVNTSGQTYASIDRAAELPDPPPFGG